MPPKKTATPKDITAGFTLKTPSQFSLTAPAGKSGPITAPMPKGKGPKGDKLPVEVDSDKDNADLEAAFYEAKRKDAARRALHQSAYYYVNVVFANRDDAQKFVEQLNLPVVAFNCVDGYVVAEKVGLDIPYNYVAEPNVNVLDSWADIALPITDPLHREHAGPLVPPAKDPTKRPAKKAPAKKTARKK